MHTTLRAGVPLVVAAPVLVGLSSALDLELEAVALSGLALGAVAALVPDRAPLARLGGLLGGVVACWIGYVVRAGALPDSTSGRMIAVALVVALCVGLALATLGRVPLWAPLVGAGALAGAFDPIYTAAPTEVVASSLAAVTSLVVCLGVGFLVCSAAQPARRVVEPSVEDLDAPRESVAVAR